MVPRERMTMVEVSAPWDETLRTVLASPFSRLPVFRGSADQVVGMLRVKDLVERYAMQGTVRVERLMRPVVHLIEDLPADRALGVLRERRAHSAIVSDANGRTAGLITIQDLLGELLGAAAPSPAPRGNAAGGPPAASTPGVSR
jgi:CBS domain containing-hemolysin-like protein